MLQMRRAYGPCLCSLLAATAILSSCGDDSEMPPPPDEPAEKSSAELAGIKPIEFDPRRSIVIKADRTITLANLIFVIQGDPIDGESIGVTLTVSRPAPDGSRMTFGAIEHVAKPEDLVKNPIRFGGSSILDLFGDGIFTTTAIYQPKFATIKFTSVEKDEVRGVVSGEFYRFSLATPTARPSVTKLSGDFIAARIDR